MAIVCSSRDETGMEDQGFVSRRICESTRKCWTLRRKEALAGGDKSAKWFGVSRKTARTAFFYVQDYVQDERSFAEEHMDVRRDRVNFARCQCMCDTNLFRLSRLID